MRKQDEFIKAIDKKLGKRIADLRVTAGLSRAVLAGKIGVTYQQVEKYEKGLNRIPAGRLILMARVFNVNAGSLLSDIESYIPLPARGGRMCTELTKAFLMIEDYEQKQSVLELVRTLISKTKH